MRPGRAGCGPGRSPPGAASASDRARQLLGLLRARLGRLVVLGPGGERVVHALARRHRAPALGDRGGEARCAEELDHPARDPGVLVEPARHLPGALRRAHLGARVRGRPRPRRVRARSARHRRRRLARALCLARAGAAGARRVRPDLARKRPAAQQPAARDGVRHRAARHPLSPAPWRPSAAPRSRSDRRTSTPPSCR